MWQTDFSVHERRAATVAGPLRMQATVLCVGWAGAVMSEQRTLLIAFCVFDGEQITSPVILEKSVGRGGCVC